MAVRVLIDDAADVIWVIAREHSVHHHLRDRDLAAHAFAARLEIDGVGETAFGLRPGAAFEAEPFSRALRPPPLPSDLAFAGDRDAGVGPRVGHSRTERRKLDVAVDR